MRLIKNQNGLTLIEIMVVLAIMATLTVGINSLISNYTDDTRSTITAQHLKAVGNAANNYIKDNYATISTMATSTTPVLIRVTDLISGGYLTTGFAVKNTRNQNTCVLVLQPTPNHLTALAVTERGDVIDDLALGKIASTIGGSGGAIYSTATTTIRGAMGSYSLPVGNYANANHLGRRCDGTAGTILLSAGHPMMALWYADDVSATSTLYRDSVPSNPSLNTMNTPILMGAGTVQVKDSACSTVGALGRSSLGAVLMCDGANWKEQGGGSAFWKDPVNTFASLPLCDAASASQVRLVRTPTVGSGARAYSCNGAGSWQALGVDNNGNMAIPGTVTLGKAAVTDVVAEGSACSPNGLVARDNAGLLLSCQSGVWKKAFGGIVGPIVPINFNTTYCLGEDVFVYGHKLSVGAVYQGVQIIVNGQIRAISRGQSEGHYGYESVGMPMQSTDCFSVGDVGGGSDRVAWYRKI